VGDTSAPAVREHRAVDVTVVGAGVIGLTTAVELERAGHRVQVVAAARGDATTSAVAGALWFPFKAHPPERVNRWAARSRERLTALAGSEPEAGVDVLTAYEAADGRDPPWWAPSVPALTFVERSPLRCPAWRFEAPRVEPAIFLAWLERQLERPIRVERVSSLQDLPGDCILHCAGLGARSLVRDDSLQAVYGQTLLVQRGELDPSLSLGDERDEAAMLYAIPRRTAVVLGGCALPCPDDRTLTPDPGITEAILARARTAGLRHGTLLGARAGLRPYRPSVRLEREGRVIHNYGHGGAGYTLAYGCAEEVVSLAAGR
jgi:D-amino-acid oxidase